MKSFIFVGQHKCGTTSIQDFLSSSYQEILKRGYLYPFSDIQSIINHRFRKTLIKSDEIDNHIENFITWRKDILEPHNKLAFKVIDEKYNSGMPPWHTNEESSKEIFNIFKYQALNKNIHTLIICSEILSLFAEYDNDLITNLLDNLDCESHEFCCLLRRPDDYLSSFFSQELFFQRIKEDINYRYYNFYKKSVHFDYKKLISSWIDTDRFKNINVGNYGEIMNELKDTTKWFLRKIGMQYLESLILLKKIRMQNKSIHKSFINIILKLNQELENDEAESLIKKIKDINIYDKLPANHEIELFTRECRLDMYETFKDINLYLGQFINKDKFFLDEEKINIANRYKLEDIEKISANLMLDQLDGTLSNSQIMILKSFI